MGRAIRPVPPRVLFVNGWHAASAELGEASREALVSHMFEELLVARKRL
jgi:hypothetical protein